MPQRRQRRFGDRRSTGSQVKKLGRSAGSWTPPTRRPAECEPSAIEERQRIGLGLERRGERGAGAVAGVGVGVARGAAGVSSGGRGLTRGPSAPRTAYATATTALAVKIKTAAPIQNRTWQTVDRGSERILTYSYGGDACRGPVRA